jgi:hypothetical protein
MPPRTTLLVTPPLALLVDPRVFDAFAWSPSTVLEWRAPAEGVEINALDPDLPLRMAFVLRTPWPALPMELARLHTGRGYDLTDEMALAPYGIDDATDQLYAHRRPAHEVFFLATGNLNALFWGLHDWVHFHNHGEFVERTATELQCDTAAMAWLWLNRARLPLDEPAWETLRAQVYANHLTRMANEPPGVALDASFLADPLRLRALADSLPSAG